jgi:hypothetical protein
MWSSAIIVVDGGDVVIVVIMVDGGDVVIDDRRWSMVAPWSSAIVDDRRCKAEAVATRILG